VGFRVQLIAVRGKEPRAVQRDYGVVSTGRREAVPESPVVGAVLPSGAYLLFINDEITPDDEVFTRLSEGGSLVACYANETVMNSYACEWDRGVERWSVYHDAQQGVEHLEATGILPNEFQPIRNRLLAEQAGSEDTDFVFDIPIELFAARGGMRYDQDIPGAGQEPWEVLGRRR
jgi:hypothetical protein